MPAKPEEAKRDSRMEQPTREDYSKHQLLFFVVAVPDNVVLTVTPFWSEAIKTYTKTHTKSVIEQQKGRGPRQVIRAQRAKA